MQLKEGTLLQNGEYKIIKVLGQGGFGITYLAEQTSLRRKVAIKEFFMKEYCERDTDTSSVSLGTSGSKELVEKFREKFVKEAQNIASFSHNNIIKIHGVFMENNTAYYVMEYLDCGSLSDYLTDRGRLSEEESLIFIRQIADALSYIHKRKVNHLDVKPGNILLDQTHNAILIDFGLSKHYDERGGQTSSTPVGISHGYAPLEQYKQGGVSTFSPSTDIYSLGATLYKLLTGTTPPEADEIYENGLGFPANVKLSDNVKKAIVFAMQSKRNDRPQSVEEFLNILGKIEPSQNSDAIQNTQLTSEETKVENEEKTKRKNYNRRMIVFITIMSIILVLSLVWMVCFTYSNVQVKGIGVSHHQKSIDWKKVVNDGVKFAYIKATEGETYIDPMFEKNMKEAQKEGVLVGVYHYFRMTSTPEKQFENFRNTLYGYEMDLVPMIGVGTSDDKRINEFQKNLDRFISLIKEEYGVSPMIYGTQRSYNTYCAPKYNNYHLYIGRYGNNSPKIIGDGTYSIWEYAEEKVDGISVSVAICKFNPKYRIKDIKMKN